MHGEEEDSSAETPAKEPQVYCKFRQLFFQRDAVTGGWISMNINDISILGTGG